MINEIEIIIPEQYRTLFDPNYRIKVYEGGRYGLKSHSIARALLIKARMSKRRILCAREVQKSIKDSVHKLFADLISEYHLTDFRTTETGIINTKTGSEFLFYGLKSANITDLTKIKSLEGITDTWVEEAQSISYESLKVLIPTVIRTQGYEIIFSLNRYTKNDPVFERYCRKKDPEILHQNLIYTDFEEFFRKLGKEQLFQQIKREAQRDKELNENEYNHIWLGEPKINKEGAVYKFNTRYHTEPNLLDRVFRELPDQKILRVWDFGLNPAVLFCAVTPQGLRIIRELVPTNRPTLSQTITMVNHLCNTELSGKYFYDICDVAGNQTNRQTGKTDIEILRANGIEPSSEQVPIEDGIVNVQNLLDRPDGLILDESCSYTIEAFEGGYYRKEDKTGLGKEMPPEQVHPYEDVMDCVRYVVWKYYKPESRQRSKEQKDFRQRARNIVEVYNI